MSGSTEHAALAICLLSFGICFYLGRRAAWAGFIATMTLGYSYGIIRANLDTRYAHFLYDFGAIGYYLALLINAESSIQRYKLRRIMPWLVALTAWPVLLLFVPTQTFLVQLVGLRGQIFFLPFLAAGAMASNEDVRKIAMGLAVLNCIALVFALLEVQFGVPAFFPFNAVDQIIYRSTDVLIGGAGTFRIPAVFVSSAAYGGNMASSLPLLVGALVQERRRRRRKLLYAAIAASAIGVFLCASRSTVVLLFVVVIGILTSGRIRDLPKFGWIVMVGFIAILVFSSTRMQRFLSLGDMRYVKARVAGSVNEGFLQLAAEYPMGNGLGGGGTSMPYFLESQVRHPVLIENEYGRIMLEEGLPGLALWLGLVLWTITRPLPRQSEQWYLGRWLARVIFGFAFLTAPLGTGLLTSIPGTALILFFAGWITAPNVIKTRKRAVRTPLAPAEATVQTA